MEGAAQEFSFVFLWTAQAVPAATIAFFHTH